MHLFTYFTNMSTIVFCWVSRLFSDTNRIISSRQMFRVRLRTIPDKMWLFVSIITVKTSLSAMLLSIHMIAVCCKMMVSLRFSRFRFIKHFRLSKIAFAYVLEQIRSTIRPTRCSALSAEEKLATCLRFFAEGSYQHRTGQDFNIAFAKPTFLKYLR